MSIASLLSQDVSCTLLLPSSLLRPCIIQTCLSLDASMIKKAYPLKYSHSLFSIENIFLFHIIVDEII